MRGSTTIVFRLILVIIIGEEYERRTRNHYQAIFEELSAELGYADYLGALERYRFEDLHDRCCRDVELAGKRCKR